MVSNGSRDDLPAKVLGTRSLQQLPQHVLAKDVHTHRGHVGPVAVRQTLQPIQLAVRGFLMERGDTPVLVGLEDPEASGIGTGDRLDGDGNVGPLLTVQRDELGVIHAVQVIAGKDHNVFDPGVDKTWKLLAHRVGRALIPIHPTGRLLGRQNVDEPTGEQVELVGLVNVAVQRCRQKLGQDVDLFDARVEAVADGHVDQAIPAADRHGRLGPQLGQRVEARALTSPQNHSQHVSHRHPIHLRS